MKHRKRRVRKDVVYLRQRGGSIVGALGRLARKALQLIPVVAPAIARVVSKPIKRVAHTLAIPLKKAGHVIAHERYTGPSRGMMKMNKADLIHPVTMLAAGIEPGMLAARIVKPLIP